MSTTPASAASAPIARPATFRQRYCQRRGLPEAAFEHHLLRRCLLPHAQLCYWLLALDRDHREADLEFVRALGDLRYLGSFNGEAADFVRHPRNRRFSRRFLRLRVSVTKARRQFESLMRAA